MKNAKTLAALTALALTVSLTACSAGKTAETTPAPTAAQAQSGHYPVTITNYNYAGEPVTYTYEKAPEKVIAVY